MDILPISPQPCPIVLMFANILEHTYLMVTISNGRNMAKSCPKLLDFPTAAKKMIDMAFGPSNPLAYFFVGKLGQNMIVNRVHREGQRFNPIHNKPVYQRLSGNLALRGSKMYGVILKQNTTAAQTRNA